MPVQRYLNLIRNTQLTYAEIQDTFQMLIDLGTVYVFRQTAVINDTDEPVVLRYGAGTETESELLLNRTGEIGNAFSYDRFLHNGPVMLKYFDVAPTVGRFIYISW